jgi:ATP-dependent DNA ligase
LQHSDHQIGRGSEFHARACELLPAGIISKRGDAPHLPGSRGLWVKVKCLNREEFVVVGWNRSRGLTTAGRGAPTGVLYYTPEGRLVYAGRAGVGINNAELERLWRRLQPLATSEMLQPGAAAVTDRAIPILVRCSLWGDCASAVQGNSDRCRLGHSLRSSPVPC